MQIHPITVVIPTHNRLEYLKEATDSVLSQGQDVELIVVDDASDDGTRKWLAEVSGGRFKAILLTEHSERSAARNRAMRESQGQYILFLDDDDRLAPHSLSGLGSALSRHPQAVAAVGAAVYFDDAGQSRRQAHPRKMGLKDVRLESMFGWPAHPGSTLWRTQVLKEVGGWPEDLSQGEDQDLWLRVAERGPVAVLPQPVLFYRKHPAQQRPPDTQTIERQLRERFIATLPAARQAEALRVLRARDLREKGVEAWRLGDLRLASRHFVAMVGTAPRLAWSPFLGARTRSLVLRGLVGWLTGPRVMARAQRMVWEIRTRLGRAPGGADVLLPAEPPSKND